MAAVAGGCVTIIRNCRKIASGKCPRKLRGTYIAVQQLLQFSRLARDLPLEDRAGLVGRSAKDAKENALALPGAEDDGTVS